MELILEKDLEHQLKAVTALSAALDGVSISRPNLAYENPTIDCYDLGLAHNISIYKKQYEMIIAAVGMRVAISILM